MPLLTTLFDAEESPALPLPPWILARYGGPLGFRTPRGRPLVFSNFVTTLDGVVSYDIPGRAHAGVISGGSDADRFLLGLLRACADAVVVGAGTLRAEPDGQWTPEFAYPAGGDHFAALRKALGKRAQPTVFIVSASGDLDVRAPVFTVQRSVVLTTKKGARRLGRRMPKAQVQVLASDRPTGRDIVDAVAMVRDCRLILTEGGPRLFGQLLHDGAIDQMFQTIAPQIAGRSRGHRRLALVEQAAFTPEQAPRSRLLSLKRSDDGLLFLRLAIRPQGAASTRS